MSSLQVTLASLRQLSDAIGPLMAARAVARIVAQQARGEPFQHLPAATTWRERGSRQQAGDAIRLYRALLALTSPEQARSVATAVITAGGVSFLKQTIGPLRRADLAALSPEERDAFLNERGQRFPNATPKWTSRQAEQVSFTIHACRLVSLVTEAGHPELGPMFCASDARFFGTVEPDVILERPTTLAGGDPACAFHLRWR